MEARLGTPLTTKAQMILLADDSLWRPTEDGRWEPYPRRPESDPHADDAT